MELFLSADTRLPYLPPTGKRPLHRHAMRIMDVYAPEPEVPYERVVWPADASAEGGADTADAGGGGAAAAATASAVPTAETTWCEPQLAKLRSKHSRHEAFVLFVNNTPYTVRILWINYRCVVKGGVGVGVSVRAWCGRRCRCCACCLVASAPL